MYQQSSMVFGQIMADHLLSEKTLTNKKLIDASKDILQKAISHIKRGVKIADIGHLMETEAKKEDPKSLKTLEDMVQEEVYKLSRNHTLKICKDAEYCYPNRGFYASQQMHFYSYKLHTVCSISGRCVIYQ